jgi:glutamate racemase
VEAGADLIAEQLIGNPGSVVIIFATQTTVDEGTHLRKLVERGVTHDRIIQQSCSELVGFIEVGYRSDQTEMLISAYVEEAVQKLPTPRPSFFASLNCTHFGYSSELWSKAFEAAGVPPRAILNPNSRMLDFLFDQRFRHRYPNPAVSVTAVSMVEIQQDRISSIGEPLQQISPETARALREYAYRPNLFEWRAFIKRPGG